MYIDAPHLQAIIDAKKVKLAPVGISREFERYLSTLPWLPSKIDWSKLSHWEAANWMDLPESAFIVWARNLAIGRHDTLMIWYQAEEPCLVCDFDYGITNLDTLFWRAPGTRYVFGADVNDGVLVPSFQDFLEFSGGSNVVGIK